MSSIYPNGIDAKAQIPIIKDGITIINASSINSLRDGIIKIETELGPLPKGDFSNVKLRIESLEDDSETVRINLTALEASLLTLISSFNILQSDYNALVIYLNSLNFLPTPINVDSAVVIEESSIYEQRVLTGSDIDGLTVALASQVSDSPTTNQNNYNPTGWSAATYLRLNPTASIMITGFEARTAGSLVILRNVSTFLILFVCENSGSLAANRLSAQSLAGESHILCMPGDVIQLAYDGTRTRWIVTRISHKMRDLGTKREWKAFNGTTFDPGLSASDLGIASVGNITNPATSTADFVSAKYRVLLTSAAATNGNYLAVENTGADDSYGIGNGSGYGGYAVFFSFGLPSQSLTDDLASTYIAIGPSHAPGAGNNFDVMTNCLAFELQSPDTTWHFQHNDGSGTATRIDLGANFPRDTATAWYNAYIYSDPNYAGISYVIWRTDDTTLTPAMGDITTNLPAANGSIIFNHTNRTSTTSHQCAFDHVVTWMPI